MISQYYDFTLYYRKVPTESITILNITYSISFLRNNITTSSYPTPGREIIILIFQ